MSGHLFMLFLETGENPKGTLVVKDLKVELLGKACKLQTSISITYNLISLQVKHQSPNASHT